jgi:heme oxygenase
VDINPVLKLARQLAAAVLSLEHHLAEATCPRDLMVMKLRKRAVTLAADLKAAIDAPQTFSAWSDWHKRNAS